MASPKQIALISATIASCIGMTVSATADAQSYRWKDERGIVHYGDIVPPQYKDSATVELSPQAVPIRAREAALTPQQRAERDARLAAEAEAMKKREQVERIDRALVSKYANSTELLRAHTQDLERFDDELRSQTIRAQSLSERAAELLSLGRKSKEQRTELRSLSNELLQSAEVLDRRIAEREKLLNRQRTEQIRFEELMSRRSPG